MQSKKKKKTHNILHLKSQGRVSFKFMIRPNKLVFSKTRLECFIHIYSIPMQLSHPYVSLFMWNHVYGLDYALFLLPGNQFSQQYGG